LNSEYAPAVEKFSVLNFFGNLKLSVRILENLFGQLILERKFLKIVNARGYFGRPFFFVSDRINFGLYGESN